MSFPKPYDWRWIIVWLVLAFVLSALLVGSRLIWLPGSFGFANLPGFFLLGLVAAFAICIFGFFGAKLLMLMTSIGVLSGLALMIGYYIRGGGWEDLAGPLVFLELTFAGLVLGIGAEFIRYLYKGPRKKSQ